LRIRSELPRSGPMKFHRRRLIGFLSRKEPNFAVIRFHHYWMHVPAITICPCMFGCKWIVIDPDSPISSQLSEIYSGMGHREQSIHSLTASDLDGPCLNLLFSGTNWECHLGFREALSSHSRLILGLKSSDIICGEISRYDSTRQTIFLYDSVLVVLDSRQIGTSISLSLHSGLYQTSL
jgi:hypothetical protein